MVVFARDISNYTQDPMPIDSWKSEGVGLGIVQALIPPINRPFANDSGHCGQQAQALLDAGIVADAYLFWQDGLPQTFEERIALMANVQIRQWWVDLEAQPGLSGAALTQSVADALAAADAAPGTTGRRAGFYSAQWWIDWYVGQGGDLSVLDNRPVWFVNWNGITNATDTFYDGNPVAVKQYAGSQPDGTDLDVLSDAEAATLTSGPDLNGLETALAYVCDDLGQQLLNVQAEMERVRVQFLGPKQ